MRRGFFWGYFSDFVIPELSSIRWKSSNPHQWLWEALHFRWELPTPQAWLEKHEIAHLVWWCFLENLHRVREFVSRPGLNHRKPTGELGQVVGRRFPRFLKSMDWFSEHLQEALHIFYGKNHGKTSLKNRWRLRKPKKKRKPLIQSQGQLLILLEPVARPGRVDLWWISPVRSVDVGQVRWKMIPSN